MGVDLKERGSGLETEEQQRQAGTLAGDLPSLLPNARRKRRLLFLGGALLVSVSAGLAILLLKNARQQGTLVEASTFDRVASSVGLGKEEPREIRAAIHENSIAPTGQTVPDMLYIDSIPDGAEVTLEGHRLGKTPLLMGGHYEGEFASLKLVKAGYEPWVGQVQIVDGGLRADVTLKPRRK